MQEYFTDTGRARDHVFGLFALIGKRFALRLRNLKDRKFHTFEKGDAYPTLSNHIGAPFNTALILYIGTICSIWRRRSRHDPWCHQQS
nr:Tn3 family transposase [Mesorhizobium waimense]